MPEPLTIKFTLRAPEGSGSLHRFVRALFAAYNFTRPISTMGAQTKWDAAKREWTECHQCIYWRYCGVHRRGKCPPGL